MVAQVLRLKLVLIANSFRRTPWQVLGLVLALLYGLGTAVFLSASLVALGFAEAELARSVVVSFGGLVILLFAVLPLALGTDDVLDPRKFSLFGLSNSALATAIGIASLASVPAVVITVIAVAQTATWARGGLAQTLSLVIVPIVIVTCVLSVRITTTLGSFLLSSRRTRQVSTFVAVVLVIAAVPFVALLINVDWANDAPVVLRGVADVIGWTPAGLAWAVPADAAVGEEGVALAKLAFAILWVLLLFVAWRLLVAKVLVAPGQQARSEKQLGLGWFDVAPGTPAGAIAARSLTYWTRDPRYIVGLAVIPFVPIGMIAALLVAGLPLQGLALLPVPVMSLFLAWSVHNDVAYDNTAIWLHLASSTRGVDDRWGRLAPALGIGAVLVLAGSVVSAALFGDWAVLPSLIGGSAAVLLGGLGLSSIVSARYPYPTVRPGDSPRQQPQAGGNASGAIQGLSLVGSLLLAAPAVAAAALGLLVAPVWHVAALILGVGIGVLVLLAGVRAGARVYDRRTSELLAAALKN